MESSSTEEGGGGRARTVGWAVSFLVLSRRRRPPQTEEMAQGHAGALASWAARPPVVRDWVGKPWPLLRREGTFSLISSLLEAGRSEREADAVSPPPPFHGRHHWSTVAPSWDPRSRRGGHYRPMETSPQKGGGGPAVDGRASRQPRQRVCDEKLTSPLRASVFSPVGQGRGKARLVSEDVFRASRPAFVSPLLCSLFSTKHHRAPPRNPLGIHSWEYPGEPGS